MDCLLDTHAILWYVDANVKLPPTLRNLIETSRCRYSIVSLWEIAIKQGLGRLNREISIFDYDRLCRQSGFIPLQILPRHLERLKTLPDIHRDPFDRLLVAQAHAEGLALVTHDRFIPQYPIETIW